MSNEFFRSNIQDAPTPLNSAGEPTQPYRNAAGDFDLRKVLERKIKSRKDQDPLFSEDDAIQRYYGDFSVESKRNARDLLKTHPEFNQTGAIRLNRVGNNTREVLPNDPTKTVENGGHIVYQNLPQTSHKDYKNDKKAY